MTFGLLVQKNVGTLFEGYIWGETNILDETKENSIANIGETKMNKKIEIHSMRNTRREKGKLQKCSSEENCNQTTWQAGLIEI